MKNIKNLPLALTTICIVVLATTSLATEKVISAFDVTIKGGPGTAKVSILPNADGTLNFVRQWNTTTTITKGKSIKGWQGHIAKCQASNLHFNPKKPMFSGSCIMMPKSDPHGKKGMLLSSFTMGQPGVTIGTGIYKGWKTIDSIKCEPLKDPTQTSCHATVKIISTGNVQLEDYSSKK